MYSSDKDAEAIITSNICVDFLEIPRSEIEVCLAIVKRIQKKIGVRVYCY